MEVFRFPVLTETEYDDAFHRTQSFTVFTLDPIYSNLNPVHKVPRYFNMNFYIILAYTLYFFGSLFYDAFLSDDIYSYTFMFHTVSWNHVFRLKFVCAFLICAWYMSTSASICPPYGTDSHTVGTPVRQGPKTLDEESQKSHLTLPPSPRFMVNKDFTFFQRHVVLQQISVLRVLIPITFLNGNCFQQSALNTTCVRSERHRTLHTQTQMFVADS
jgi:hypothetical protein